MSEAPAVSPACLSDWEELLQFWFADACDSPARALARVPFWFEATAENDAEMRARFGATVEAALAGRLDQWADNTRGRLALIIVLDQLTRNLNRGSAAAFAGDAAALGLAIEALDSGAEAELHLVERMFLAVPLEHAEDGAVQARSLAHAQAQHAGAAPQWQPLTAGTLDAVREHHDIIARFGRFPHRNEALGRASSEAELNYLQAGARRFGQ